MNRVIAIIPVRAGSKRCPQKNVRPFAGKSLTILACEQALRLNNLFADIVLTTNDPLAIEQCKSLGDGIIVRESPEELCTSEASSESAIEDVLEYMKEIKGATYTHICLLEVTSPLRLDTDIIDSLKLAEETGMGVKSVCAVKNCLSVEIVESKQQLNGAIHIWLTSWIRDTPYDRFALYEMGPSRSIHIDYEWEFLVAETLYKKRQIGRCGRQPEYYHWIPTSLSNPC